MTVPLPGEDGTSDQNTNERRRCVWLFCRVWLDQDHEPECVCDRLTVGAAALATSSRMYPEMKHTAPLVGVNDGDAYVVPVETDWLGENSDAGVPMVIAASGSRSARR